MTRKGDDDSPAASLVSPLCSMHEADPTYMGLEKETSTFGSPGENELARLKNVLLHELPDAVIYADNGGLIRFWNRGAARIFGFSAAQAVGQSLDIIIPEQLRQRHWEGYHRMMSTGHSRHEAHELLAVPAVDRSGRTLSIQFTVAPVADENDSLIGIVAILRDVTATFEEIKRLRAGRS
ncbi:MAG: PAS domain S-box protein [Halieaceae bacterium]|nr:PAS domain S-box protein [Halieaceae bacterium]